MSLKLDWDIESEQGKHQEHQEDFKQRSRRYLGFLRLLVIVALFSSLLGAVVFIVFKRLDQVNSRIEQLLHETVAAEVASLRIGDFNSYIDIQRSASDDWYVLQEQTFNEYQQLKSSADITLTGQIITSEVDGQRGRVQIEEIINGVPFAQTWFYWRYDDGWRHVPPDYTFWGEFATITMERFAIRYHLVDEPVARALSEQVSLWLDDACSYLDCSMLPLLTFDIVTEYLPEAYWAPNEEFAWQMVLSSPYLHQARLDNPLSQTLQVDIASLLANRLIDTVLNKASITYPSDAYFLHSSLVAWMVGRFVQVNPETYFVDSLVNNYGIPTLQEVLRAWQQEINLATLAPILGVSTIADANLDWRDFIAWRLRTEYELIQRSDEANWQRLYDFSDVQVREIAYNLYRDEVGFVFHRIIDLSYITGQDGMDQLLVQYEVDRNGQSSTRVAYFRLVNEVWLRIS